MNDLESKINALSMCGITVEYRGNGVLGIVVGDIKLKKLVIPEGVTTLIRLDSLESAGDKYFNTVLETVVLPSSVKTLGLRLFENARELRNVIINGNELEIGEDCFCGCEELKQIDFSKMKSIGIASFSSCGLEYIDLSVIKEPIHFKHGVFSTNDNLKEVNFGSIEEISSMMFLNCYNLENIKLPSSIKRIGRYAFCNCAKLMTADLKDTKILELDERTFGVCTELKKLKLPNTLQKIKEYALEGVGLDVLDISNTAISNYDCFEASALNNAEISTLIVSDKFHHNDVELKLFRMGNKLKNKLTVRRVNGEVLGSIGI